MLGSAYVRMACLAVLFCMTVHSAVSIRELSATADLTETVSGQVLDIIDSAPICTVVLFDETGGIPLYVDSKDLRGAMRGDLVTARVAHAFWTYHAKTFAVTGHAPLPAPVEIPVAELENRICRPVAIRGVLRSVRSDPVDSGWNWMSFATPSGTIPVATREADFPIAGLRPLLDAELRLAGYAQPMVAWRAGLGLHFTPVKDYPPDVLVRIIRELASNAVNHGHATVIRIAGAIEDSRLLFSVQDDGSGFDPYDRPGVAEGHFGLEGIADRVARLQGEMKLESTPRKGTAVTISLKT